MTGPIGSRSSSSSRSGSRSMGGLGNPAARIMFRRVGGVVCALLIWELFSETGVINKSALPTPQATAVAFVHNLSGLGRGALGTLEAWGLGLLAASVFGVAIGVVVGRSRVADSLTETLVRMMRPLPSLALIPIAILIAGLGLKMTAGLVSFAAFWSIFINTRVGVRQIDNLILETGRMLGMERLELIRKVVIPAALPMIATGVQVAISLALVVTVSVELVGGTGGLGQFVLVAQQGGATATMYAGIILGGMLGWALSMGYSRIVDRWIPWRSRGQVTTS